MFGQTKTFAVLTFIKIHDINLFQVVFGEKRISNMLKFFVQVTK